MAAGRCAYEVSTVTKGPTELHQLTTPASGVGGGGGGRTTPGSGILRAQQKGSESRSLAISKEFRMKKEGQKVPALHPPPSFLRTRADCAFLFHSFAFDTVGEAPGRLVSVS